MLYKAVAYLEVVLSLGYNILSSSLAGSYVLIERSCLLHHDVAG